MLSSKHLIDIFMTSLWISCSFLCVTISCVHPSLWIDIIMILIYLESYTLERSYISSWHPYSFTSTFFLGGFVKGFILSAGLISLHRDALFCGEDSFSLACLDEAFHFVWYPSSWQAIIIYLHHGSSQVLFFKLFFGELVNPFAS